MRNPMPRISDELRALLIEEVPQYTDRDLSARLDTAGEQAAGEQAAGEEPTGEAEPLGALAALVEAAYLVALGDGSVDRRELLDTNARLQRIVGGGVPIQRALLVLSRHAPRRAAVIPEEQRRREIVESVEAVRRRGEALGEELRRLVVLAAIHASLVDGRFEQAEHKALLALGSALGLPAAEMDQLIHDEMDAWS